MEDFNYEIEDRLREKHWWFLVRQWLFARQIRSLALPSDAAILDVGTGTGTNLQMLRQLGFTNVKGLDLSPHAIGYCHGKGLGPVAGGSIEEIPFAAGSFDLVLATDVIEHVDDDARATGEVARVLKPGGTALITVPAFQSLWGLQDEVSHHKRRYRLGELGRLVASSGLTKRRAFYFNYLLFLPIFLARQWIHLAKPKIRNENELNSPLVNAILKRIFYVDALTAPWVHPFAGVSAFVLADKKS